MGVLDDIKDGLDVLQNEENKKWHHALNHTTWNIILIIYAQITATLVQLIDCRPLGKKMVMFYQGSVKCWDPIHGICFFFLFCCLIFPFVLIIILFRTRKMYGMGYLRRAYPSLVINYRKDCWWYSSFSLLRRFLIIVISAVPAERSDVKSTFLAIVVGLIFGYHLFLQPMHFRINNYGETFVWFVALSLTTMNIIDFASIKNENNLNALQILMTVLVFSLFIPMPLLLLSFVKAKSPFIILWNIPISKQKEDDKIFGKIILRKKSHSIDKKKIITFDKKQFDQKRDDAKKKKLNNMNLMQQIGIELNQWLVHQNQTDQTLTNQNGETLLKEKSHDIDRKNSVSSDEKEMHQNQMMDKHIKEMLEENDVHIFTSNELQQIRERDQIEHTPRSNRKSFDDILENADTQRSNQRAFI